MTARRITTIHDENVDRIVLAIGTLTTVIAVLGTVGIVIAVRALIVLTPVRL